jgi:CBS domain-containing protein
MEKIKLIKADTAGRNESVRSIAKKMHSKKKRRFYIVDKEKKLEGVVTTVDIMKAIALGKDVTKTKVSDIMCRKVKAISVDDNIDDALKIMNSLKTFVCPVVKDGKLLGVITYQDIISNLVVSSRS